MAHQRGTPASDHLTLEGDQGVYEGCRRVLKKEGFIRIPVLFPGKEFKKESKTGLYGD